MLIKANDVDTKTYLDEIRILARLQSPLVVKYFDAWPEKKLDEKSDSDDSCWDIK